MKIKTLCLAAALLPLALVGACRTYPDYSTDFRFPVERGDVTRGQQLFAELECTRCHTVEGVNLPAPAGGRTLTVPLGGELIVAKTFGDLVTSIINPDHAISERYLDQLPAQARRSLLDSPMPYHSEMTVSQLIDVVTFLNARYSLLPGYTEYFY